METKNILKTVFLAAYILVVVFVPQMPSYYTFAVSTVGYISTITASVLIIQFLNSRPPAQINLLNRLLALLLLATALAATRCYFLTTIACWANQELAQFVENQQLFSSTVLSLNTYSAICACCFLALCGGRLLLFACPQLYVKLPPRVTAFIVGSVSVSISIINNVYYATCTHFADSKSHELLTHVREELGIVKSIVSLNQTSVGNLTVEAHEKVGCLLPTNGILLVIAIVLEIVKTVISVLREYKKQIKKSNLILMTTVGKKPKSYQLQRSETFPKIRKSLLTSQAHSERSKSCPCLKATNKAELTDAELTVRTDDQTTKAQHTKRTIVTKILLDLCLRSATIITLCAIFAILTVSFNDIRFRSTNSTVSSLGVALNTATGRLVYYCMTIVIFIYDVDVFNHCLERFNLN